MRSFSSLFAAFTIMAMAIPAGAFAAPTADLAQMQQAWSAVKSVHVDEKMSDGKSIGIDMVMPDKFHETLPTMQIIVIGSGMWMYMNSKWMKMPIVMPQMKTWIQWAKSNGLTSSPKDYDVSDLGPAMIGTVPTEPYKLVDKTRGTTTEMWLGKNHLPVQVYVPNGKQSMMITYSKYDQVGDIAPPA